MNGVGGITVEGQVSGYEYTLNEKSGVYNVKWYVRTSTGTYDVNMSLSPSGRADARISSNWPGQLNYLGNVLPISRSTVFKGISRY
jgi:hypothetical protein